MVEGKEIHPKFTLKLQKNWERLFFSYQEVKEWLNTGLEPSDFNFVAYLRGKGYNSQQTLDYVNLKKEYRSWAMGNASAQEGLDYYYPKEKRSEVEYLKVKSVKGGGLIVENFANLKELDCFQKDISSLSIINCPNVSHICCSVNLIMNGDFLNDLNPENLVTLRIARNPPDGVQFLRLPIPFQNLTVFSRFINLTFLEASLTLFHGSLKPLENINRLKELDISYTHIDSGLEYLPDSIEIFRCGAGNFTCDYRVKSLELELKRYGNPEDNNHNFAPLLKIGQHAHRKAIAEQKSNSEQQLLLELEELGIIPNQLSLPELLNDSNSITQQLNQAEQRLTAKLTSQSHREITFLEQQVSSLRITAPTGDGTNIHSDFTDQLTQQWQARGFSYAQTNEGINAGFQLNDYDLINYIQDELNLTAETVLNRYDRTTLELKYQTYLIRQSFQARIQIPPRHD